MSKSMSKSTSKSTSKSMSIFCVISSQLLPKNPIMFRVSTLNNIGSIIPVGFATEFILEGHGRNTSGDIIKGFKVSDTGYFVYVNGKKDKEAFDGKLEFDVTLFPHIGNDTWVEAKIAEINTCLTGNDLPEPSESCEYCGYRKLAQQVQLPYAKRKTPIK
jgi:hypothetical protein